MKVSKLPVAEQYNERYRTTVTETNGALLSEV